MLKAKIKAKLVKIKSSTYQLRVYKQLPFYLCYLIYNLNGSEDTKYVKYLIEMSQHFMRVRGYYKQYPIEEQASEKIIKEGLEKMGYAVLDIKAK